MNILVINGDCLQVNTSANLCHLSYIQGLIDAGHNVTVLSADGRDYKTDPLMTIAPQAKSVTYYGVSFYEKLALNRKHSETDRDRIHGETNTGSGSVSIRSSIINGLKRIVRSYYGPHGIYKTFAKKAVKFRSDEEFDYILSIATPASSHLIAHSLITRRHVKARHWIQIWEDPWYAGIDIKAGKRIKREEKRLLKWAEKICYVSPVTLEYQKKLFPECAEKMYWQPLPYYYKQSVSTRQRQANLYGYFGEYVPISRNLRPFYEAAHKESIEVNICGNPVGLLESTEKIHIYPRLSLDNLKPLEDETTVLVFLCNRAGGQIPGKIYQYSASDKAILFILDGTEEEKAAIKGYFEQFNRYVFCDNNVNDIRRAIDLIEKNRMGSVRNAPVKAFDPQVIVNHILEGR